MSTYHQRVCICWVILATSATMLAQVHPEKFTAKGSSSDRLLASHQKFDKVKFTKSRHFWAALERFLNEYERSHAGSTTTDRPNDDDDDDLDDPNDDGVQDDQIITPATKPMQKDKEDLIQEPSQEVPSPRNNILGSDTKQEYAKDEGGEPVSQVATHHPYMETIYEEIEEKRHQKWSEIETDAAKIRGIEPFNIIQEKRQSAAVLEFGTATLHSLKHIRHVDLILTTNSKHPTITSDTFQVEPLFSKTPHKVPQAARISSYKWLTTTQNQFYLVLELTPNVWHRWNRAFFKSNELLALRLSHAGSSELPLQRPLLVFYYTVSPAEKNKDMERFSLSNALERVRRRVHVYTPPRLCKKCMLGTRKNPIVPSDGELPEHSCALHKWIVTLPELGWENWVIAPYEFFVDYCSGPCQPPIFSLINTTYNAVVRSIVANRTSRSTSSSSSSKSKTIPPPSCVPTLLKPINIIYNDNGTAVINKLENMVAQACGCS